MALERFEDIAAWKKGRELAKAVYDVTAVGSFRRDFSLRDQIRRASVSVVSNIAETGRLIGGFMRYLHQSEYKGSKFSNTRESAKRQLGTRNSLRGGPCVRCSAH